jgi:drug/metabolite transporter (DMT)-like permease
LQHQVEGSGLATLLGNFQGLLMARAGFLLYRERLGWHFIDGVVLGFIGLYLLVGLDWSAVGSDIGSASFS